MEESRVDDSGLEITCIQPCGYDCLLAHPLNPLMETPAKHPDGSSPQLSLKSGLDCPTLDGSDNACPPGTS